MDKQYVEILKEVNADYDADLKTGLFDEVIEEYWVELESFRQMAINLTKPFEFFSSDSDKNLKHILRLEEYRDQKN